MTEEVYSTCGETFQYNYQEAIDEALDSGQSVVYEGKPVPFSHFDFVKINNIIESIQEEAWHLGQEFSEGYLEDLSNKEIEELKFLICTFLEEKVGTPKFYKVINIKSSSGG